MEPSKRSTLDGAGRGVGLGPLRPTATASAHGTALRARWVGGSAAYSFQKNFQGLCFRSLASSCKSSNNCSSMTSAPTLPRPCFM